MLLLYAIADSHHLEKISSDTTTVDLLSKDQVLIYGSRLIY